MNKFAFAVMAVIFVGSASAQGIVIDHSCTDLASIPQVWITSVQNNIQSHYAHTSHGGQLTYGIGFIEDGDPFYAVEIGSSYLPSTSGAYCVFDGQEGQSYIGPELYWQTAAGLNLTRDVLDNNPTLDTSMWSWCTQCNSYSESQVQAYLDAMSLLESEYPNVTFIYLTGNAQATGSSGYNRFLRNNQIRDYCTTNNKVLFDFADLDCWWYNASSSQWEQHTYDYSGTPVPAEHPEYYGDEYGHTTAESCIQKGIAWWWMMAQLAGWSASGVSEEAGQSSGVSISLFNPVTVPAQFTVEMAETGSLSVNVLDVTGRVVGHVFNGIVESGSHQFLLADLNSGVYLIRLTSSDEHLCRRMVVVD